MKRSFGPFLLLVFVLLFARPPRPGEGRRHRLDPPRACVLVPEAVPDFSESPGESPEPLSAAPSREPSMGEETLRDVGIIEDIGLPSLGWLLARQNSDGSWGKGMAFLDGHWVSRVGETSLALLAFLGAGYSHLSRDRYGDHETGSAVRAAARWLMAEVGSDGVFRSVRDGSLEQVLGTLALCEIYGLTGSSLFKESAQNALDGLRGFQLEDGSFGDAMTTDWALSALQSARLSELNLWEGGLDRLRPAYERRELAAPDAGTALFRIWLDRSKGDDRVRRAAEIVYSRSSAAGNGSMHEIYRDSLALYQVDGPSGELWKAWSPALKETLRRTDAGRLWEGSPRDASVVDAALAALCSEIFFRYSPQFVPVETSPSGGVPVVEPSEK